MSRDATALKRQLKIKSDSVSRLGRELKYYMKEQHEVESKLIGLREEQADALTIKKTEEFVDESSSVVQDTHARLLKCFSDLEGFVDSSKSEEGIVGTEELAKAETIIGETASLVRS